MVRDTIFAALAALLTTTVALPALAAGDISAPCSSDASCNAEFVCVANNCVPEAKMRVVLSWNSGADLDLHLRTPSGAVISPLLEGEVMVDGGKLARDECYNEENCEGDSGHPNIEVITWAWGSPAAEGNYEVWATNWDGREAANYDVTVQTPQGNELTFVGGVAGAESAEGPRHSFELEAWECDDDRDRDGICDKWELEGIDIDEDGRIDLDLPGLGADPNHKDMFIEIDRFRGEDVLGVGGVIASFANAPVSNPDGRSGITLHVMIDEEIDAYGGNPLYGQDPFDTADTGIVKFGTNSITDETTSCGDRGWFGAAADRSSSNCENIIKARKQVYRYVVYAYELTQKGVLGKAELPGNDFVVSVGHYQSDNDQAVQEGTFMHELGHTMGLRHGGSTNLPHCKPNYLSVMNYAYALEDNYAGRPLAFSAARLPDLDEDSLDENAGIGGPSSWTQVVFPNPNSLFHPWVITNRDASQPVNWNETGDSTDTGVTRVVSGRPYSGPGTPQVLAGHDDWAAVIINFRNTPGYNASFPGADAALELERPHEEYVENAKNSDTDADGLNNYDDNCPTVVNEDQNDFDGDGVGDACDVCYGTPAPRMRDGCPAHGAPKHEHTFDSFGEPSDDKRTVETSPQLQPEAGCNTASGTPNTVLLLLGVVLIASRRRRPNIEPIAAQGEQ